MTNKPQDKGKGKGKGRRKGKGRDKPIPGVILSWEDWSEEAMRDYLAATTEELADLLDEQEQAFRGGN